MPLGVFKKKKKIVTEKIKAEDKNVKESKLFKSYRGAQDF